MDFALRAAAALLVAVLVIACIAGLVAVVSGVVTPASSGVVALQGSSAGGASGAFRDSEYIDGSGGAAVEMSPADVVAWASALVFPANPPDAEFGVDGWTGGVERRGWILVVLSAIGGLLGSWIGLRWVMRFVFGS